MGLVAARCAGSSLRLTALQGCGKHHTSADVTQLRKPAAFNADARSAGCSEYRYLNAQRSARCGTARRAITTVSYKSLFHQPWCGAILPFMPRLPTGLNVTLDL